MCMKFKEVTGRENKGNVERLKGMLKEAIDQKKTAVIIRIPVEMLDIDESYQIEERTARSLTYLVSKWDDNKCLPLSGVPHWEEGKVYLFDGYGRWIGSQMIKKPKKELDVMVILNAPKRHNERREYEAKMYAFQNAQVAKMTALQKHGAMLILHDEATEVLEEMRCKYKFEYSAIKGNRGASILGSYTEALTICKKGKNAANFVFGICKKAGFDRKANGYSTYIMRSLKDIWCLYPDNRDEISNTIIKYLRKIDPVFLKSEAVVKYPLLDYKTATSLYLEDIIVRDMNETHKRTVENGKVVTVINSDSLKAKA